MTAGCWFEEDQLRAVWCKVCQSLQATAHCLSQQKSKHTDPGDPSLSAQIRKQSPGHSFWWWTSSCSRIFLYRFRAKFPQNRTLLQSFVQQVPLVTRNVYWKHDDLGCCQLHWAVAERSWRHNLRCEVPAFVYSANLRRCWVWPFFKRGKAPIPTNRHCAFKIGIILSSYEHNEQFLICQSNQC